MLTTYLILLPRCGSNVLALSAYTISKTFPENELSRFTAAITR